MTDRITAPTLLVQGEEDTLFGLDQADATARQIAAAGGTVAGALVRRRPRRRRAGPAACATPIGDWFDH